VTRYATHIDYSDKGPQTVYEGREFTAEITFCVTEDATEDEVEEWLQFELGGGSMSSDHPMIDADLNRVEVYGVRRTGRKRFTDWEAQTEDGRRSGRGRVEYDREDA
jgi:hypothetical protein